MLVVLDVHYFLRAPGGKRELAEVPLWMMSGAGCGGPSIRPTTGPLAWCSRSVSPTTTTITIQATTPQEEGHKTVPQLREGHG